jgi:TonB family protein
MHNILSAKLNRFGQEEAKKKHLAGAVLLHVVIAKDGSVKSVEPVRGDPLFVQAAVDAMKQWRYKPTLLNGVPVEVDTAVEVPVAKCAE